jgi:hypothetical protein
VLLVTAVMLLAEVILVGITETDVVDELTEFATVEDSIVVVVVLFVLEDDDDEGEEELIDDVIVVVLVVAVETLVEVDEEELEEVVTFEYVNLVLATAEWPSPPHVALTTYVPGTQQGVPPQNIGPPETVVPL